LPLLELVGQRLQQPFLVLMRPYRNVQFTVPGSTQIKRAERRGGLGERIHPYLLEVSALFQHLVRIGQELGGRPLPLIGRRLLAYLPGPLPDALSHFHATAAGIRPEKDGMGIEIVEQGCRLFVEYGQYRLERASLIAFLDPFQPNVPGGGREHPVPDIGIDRLLGSGTGFGVEDDLAGGEQDHIFQNPQRTLTAGMEQADGIQLVAKEFEPERPLVEGRMEVENPPASAEVAVFLDQRDRIVAAFDEPPTEGVEVQLLPLDPVIHVLDQQRGGHEAFEQSQGRGHDHHG